MPSRVLNANLSFALRPLLKAWPQFVTALLIGSQPVYAEQVQPKRNMPRFAESRCLADLTPFAPASVLNEQARAELLPLITYLTVPAWPRIVDEPYVMTKDGVTEIFPAAFNYLDWLIYASFEYFILVDPNLGPHAYKAAVQHELGHAVFAASMSKYNLFWANHYKHISAPKTTNIMSRFINFAPEPIGLTELSQSYQELFVDLMPVLASRDPDIMVFTLGHIGLGAKSAGRNFQTRAGMCVTGDDNCHDVFLPARLFIWRQYFADRKNTGREAEILAGIFDVIAREILERDLTKGLRHLSPEVMNERLIERLRIKLSPYG